VTDKDSSFKSFELNLVLDDSNRLNVIDHVNLKGVTADAETLSAFLNVPIWHASSNKT
jgi:Fe2+ transport system protein B